MDQEIQRSFRLDGLAMLVDGRLLSLYTEGKTGAHEQIAFANVLIVNKTDLVSAGEVAEMERWLRTVNGTARVRSTSYGNLPLEQLLNIGRHAIDRALGRGTRPSDARHPRAAAPERGAYRGRRGATAADRAGQGLARRRRRIPARDRLGQRRRRAGRRDRGGRRRGAARQPTVTRSLRRTVHEGAINAIAWQPGQARVATAGEDGAVRILQVGADEPLVVVRPARQDDRRHRLEPEGRHARGRQGRRGLALRRRRQADPPHPGRRQHDHRPHLVARRRRHRRARATAACT